MCELADESHVWVLEHDVEMLDGVDGFERPPVLEPDHLRCAVSIPSSRLCETTHTEREGESTYPVGRHMAAEGPLDEVIDLLACPWRQVIGDWVVFEIELGPDDKMDDVLLDPVRPIIV